MNDAFPPERRLSRLVNFILRYDMVFILHYGRLCSEMNNNYNNDDRGHRIIPKAAGSSFAIYVVASACQWKWQLEQNGCNIGESICIDALTRKVLYVRSCVCT
jgi:hypothetical protein